MIDNRNPWLKIDNQLRQYHEKQYDNIYESTKFTAECLKEITKNIEGLHFIDVGTGGGANLLHIAQVLKTHSFLGIDINDVFINYAIEEHKKRNIKNTTFQVKSYTSLDSRCCDIIGCSQVLSVLEMKEYSSFLDKLFSSCKKGVFFYSLFTERELEHEIRIHDHINNKIVPYNIYSLPLIEQAAKDKGFNLSYKKKFTIDIDLENTHKGRGTYTIKNKNLERMLFTDVVYLPWYFLYFEKTEQ